MTTTEYIQMHSLLNDIREERQTTTIAHTNGKARDILWKNFSQRLKHVIIAR